MPATSITVIQRLVVSSFVIVKAATMPSPLFAQNDSALRAQVEEFQQSLKTAWEAEDRDSVLAHFQHGDLLPPTRAQYSMLGRFPFWENPLASVSRNDDGTLNAEFIMDLGADQPAVRMAFTLVVTQQGRLQVKSTATPEQLAEGRRQLEQRQQLAGEASNVESILEARPAFDSELLPIFKATFWKLLEEQAARAGQSVTPEMREGFVFRALGEVRVGDKAVLLTLFAAEDEARPTAVGFLRQAGNWVIWKESLGRADSVRAFLGDSGNRQVLRRAGLRVEELPAFHHYSRTALRGQYEVAEEEGDAKGLVNLFEQAMAGRSVWSMWEVEQELRYGPDPVASVRLGKRQLDDQRGVVSFEVVDEDGDVELSPVAVAREGDGWIIDGPFKTPSDLTGELFDELGYALRDFKDANEVYPDVSNIEQLYAALQSVQPDLESVAADAWGTPFRYVRSKDGTTYRLISAGADKEFDHGDWDPTPARIRDMESLDPNEDIVHENGRFGRWHKRGIW